MPKSVCTRTNITVWLQNSAVCIKYFKKLSNNYCFCESSAEPCFFHFTEAVIYYSIFYLSLKYYDGSET